MLASDEPRNSRTRTDSPTPHYAGAKARDGDYTSKWIAGPWRVYGSLSVSMSSRPTGSFRQRPKTLAGGKDANPRRPSKENGQTY